MAIRCGIVIMCNDLTTRMSALVHDQAFAAAVFDALPIRVGILSTLVLCVNGTNTGLPGWVWLL